MKIALSAAELAGHTRPRGYAGGLLVKVYEPSPPHGVALVARPSSGRFVEIPLRRPRLLFSGFVKRSTPLREYLWLPKVGTRRILAVGCEGRALAVHVA
jgi:hypothetical protein